MSQPQPQLAAIPPLTSEGATGFQYKSTGSIASGGLTIGKRNGHRRTLVDVFFEGETAGIFLDIQIGDRTYVRIPTTLGDYTALANAQKGVGLVKNEGVKKNGKGLLWALSQIIPFDFPTSAQDEDLIITPVAPLGYGALPGSYAISAIYADTDQGDVVSKVVPGGSAAARRLWCNIVTNGTAQPTAGQNALDTLAMPKGMLGFKDSDLVPPGTKFTAYFLAHDASALGTTTGANANGKPTRLHVKDTDLELFTVEDQEGLLVDRDIQNVLVADFALQTWFVPKDPYVFNAQRKIAMQLDTSQKAGTGANYGANTQAFIIMGIREPIGP